MQLQAETPSPDCDQIVSSEPFLSPPHSPFLGSLHQATVKRQFSATLGLPLEKETAPTPVFSPGESQGWRSLLGCHLWGCTESDTTEVT